MLVGVTGKFTPLTVVPNLLPPVIVVNHPIVYPVDVAFNWLISPHVIVDGVAVRFVGNEDDEFTTTVTELLVELAHETWFHDIITWPFPWL